MTGDLLARAEAMHDRYLADRQPGESIPQWYDRTRRFAHGRDASIARAWYDTADVCPLCRGATAAYDVKGTDRRVCLDCLDGIPLELHNPPAVTA